MIRIAGSTRTCRNRSTNRLTAIWNDHANYINSEEQHTHYCLWAFASQPTAVYSYRFSAHKQLTEGPCRHPRSA